MKLIGHKEDGNLLLECTPREYQALINLSEVSKGHNLPMQLRVSEYSLDEDEALVLEAIYDWTFAKDRANSLRNMATTIDRALGLKESE